MRCPILNELPSPPPGRTGWPWTAESEQLPETMPVPSGTEGSEVEGAGGAPWPRVSIVTPSYNQGQFIEETIRSVLLQGYPDLEYIIMDGGSTDDSVEVIRKYEPWLAYWVSEKDEGQADAIAKGWNIAKGEIIAWLNSDDAYLPNAIRQATACLQDKSLGAVYSDVLFVDEHSNVFQHALRPPFDLTKMSDSFCPVCQPSLFLRRAAITKVGGINTHLQYTMDHDLLLRLSIRYNLLHVAVDWAMDRTWSGRKSKAEVLPFRQELVQTWESFLSRNDLPDSLMQTAPRILAHAYLRAAVAAALAQSQLLNQYAGKAVSLWPAIALEDQMLWACFASEGISRDPGLVGQVLQALIHQSLSGMKRPMKGIHRAILGKIWINHAFEHFDHNHIEVLRGTYFALYYNPHYIRDRGFLKRAIISLVGAFRSLQLGR